MLTKYANAATDVDSMVTIPLVAGQQYKLVAVAQVLGEDPNGSTSLLPTANISTHLPGSRPIADHALGGLRIAAIKNYDSDSSLVSTETYKYTGGVLINNNLGVLQGYASVLFYICWI